MHRWTPLNERQLSLLTRIAGGAEPVTSDSPQLALTARALKERGLIAMPKAAGKWRAEITDAGRFYLQHGHHPDKPAQVPREKQPAATDADAHRRPAPAQRPATAGDVKAKKPSSRPPARPSLDVPGPDLIEKVQKAGRFLRIPNPDAAERARYRRAFDAARQCAPPGYHLKYSGRAKGDFFLGLLRITGEDETEWNRIRLQRSRVITDIEDVLAAVAEDHSAFEISDDVLPRVLSLLRLLADEAEHRLGDIAVSKKRKQPRPLLTVHGRIYEVSFRERQKQVRYVPSSPGGGERTTGSGSLHSTGSSRPESWNCTSVRRRATTAGRRTGQTRPRNRWRVRSARSSER